MRHRPADDPKFSSLANRVGGDGTDAWELHSAGMQRKRAGEDVLILSIGEDLDSQTPSPIVDSAVSALHDGQHHYSPLAGTAALRERICENHIQTTQQQISPDNIVVFAGAQNALFSVSLCLAERDDEVIVIEPYYSTYPATFSAGGAKLVRIQASPNNQFLPDINLIEAAITPATRLLVINTPNNPTGVIYPASFIEAVVALCEKQGIWLLSDEVYARFIFDGEHCSPAMRMDSEQRCVVVSSLSKSHLMSGWRIGWATGPRALCERLSDLVLCMNYGIPKFIQTAATTALEQPAHTVTDHVNQYADRASQVVEALTGIERVRLTTPRSGMFVMFDVEQLGISANAFAHEVLNKHGVGLLPCDGFGSGMQNHIRMSLCADGRDLARACDAIAQVARSCRG